MDILFGIILGVIGSLIASFIFVPLRAGLSEVWHTSRRILDTNVIDITDSWNAEFSEPDEAGNYDTVKEVVKLKQYGVTVKGTSSIGGSLPRHFKYQLRLVHNLLIGHYRVSGAARGAVSGSGVLLLSLSDDRRSLDGKCIWLDRDTKKIEVSDYSMKRIE